MQTNNSTMNTDSSTPLWKVLNSNRTQGEWVAKRTRGNNEYEFKIVVPSIKTICEMEADDRDDIIHVQANAAYSALAVNSLAILAEALQKFVDGVDVIVEGAEPGARKDVYKSIQKSNAYNQAKEALKAIS